MLSNSIESSCFPIDVIRLEYKTEYTGLIIMKPTTVPA